MAEAVTLVLPDEVARQARETARRTGRPLEEVLTDWIRRGAASDDTTSLAPGVEYPLYTPYGNEAAAQELLDALHTASAPQTTDQEQ
jgi:hypothetical protein